MIFSAVSFFGNLSEEIPFKYSALKFLTSWDDVIIKGGSCVAIVIGVEKIDDWLVWIITGVYPSFSVMKSFPSLVNIR